jgi:hypothetical protein
MKPVLAFSSLVLFSPGCSQVLDVDHYERTTAGTLDSCGGLSYPNASCGTCMQACCTEAAACATDPACAAIENCYARCAPGDVDCFGTCSSSVPYSTRAQRQLERCLANRCEKDCNVGCARTMSPTRARCFAVQPQACETERAIYADDASFAWWDCQARCHPSVTNPVPEIDACGCLSAHPDAAPLAQAKTAADKACARVAPDWSCLGSVQWPVNGEPEPLDYRLTLTDAQTAAPLPGVSVSLCSLPDATCSQPLDRVVTSDQDGKVQLSLTRRINGSPDYFGYMLFQGESIVDTPYLWLPPPRQSEVTMRGFISPLIRSLLYAPTGRPLQPNLGSIGVAITDCNYLGFAEGMTLESEPPGETCYLLAAGASCEATMTGPAGYAAVINLQPGIVHFTVRQAATRRVVAEFDAPISADRYTIALVPPTPLD